MALDAKKRLRIEELAKQLQALMAEDFDDQPGNVKSFDDLETTSVTVGDEVSRILLESASKKRIPDLPVPTACPHCQRQCQQAEPEPRVLQTRRGEVTWLEDKYYCRHCRRSFFPGKPPVGAGCQ